VALAAAFAGVAGWLGGHTAVAAGGDDENGIESASYTVVAW
jgi:hypothetical protein